MRQVSATSTPPRSSPRTSSWRRSRSGGRTGVPDNPARLADHDRAVPRRRPDPPPRHPARQVPAGGRLAAEMHGEHDLDEIVDGDLADDLLGLIFMACHPILSPDARSALTLKLVCGLSTDEVARAFLTPGADHRPAHRAGQAHARRGEGAVRAARDGGAAGPPGCRTRGHLSGLQRGLLGHQRRPVVPRRSVRRGASAGPDAGRADAVRHRDARPAGADGAPGLAAAGAQRTRRRAGAPARPGPHPLGPPADPARAGEHRPDRAAAAAPSVRTPCRRRSPPATRGPR